MRRSPSPTLRVERGCCCCCWWWCCCCWNLPVGGFTDEDIFCTPPLPFPLPPPPPALPPPLPHALNWCRSSPLAATAATAAGDDEDDDAEADSGNPLAAFPCPCMFPRSRDTDGRRARGFPAPLPAATAFPCDLSSQRPPPPPPASNEEARKGLSLEAGASGYRPAPRVAAAPAAAAPAAETVDVNLIDRGAVVAVPSMGAGAAAAVMTVATG